MAYDNQGQEESASTKNTGFAGAAADAAGTTFEVKVVPSKPGIVESIVMFFLKTLMNLRKRFKRNEVTLKALLSFLVEGGRFVSSNLRRRSRLPRRASTSLDAVAPRDCVICRRARPRHPV